MPVFKVRLGGKTSKVMVLADGLDQLKQVAASKLQLNDSALYTVCDDSDGTAIDADDCLLALSEFANSRGEHLLVALLLQGEEWSSTNLSSSGGGTQQVTPQLGSSGGTQESTSGLGSSGGHAEAVHIATSDAQDVMDVSRTVLPALPYQDITRQLKQALKAPSHLRNRALARSRRNVIKTLTEKLKTKTLEPGTLRKVCTKIQRSCPEAFIISIRDDSNVSCLKQFCSSLYNSLGYVRDTEGIRSRVRRSSRRVSDETENPDEPDPDEVPFIRVDTNGYADGMWAPLLQDDQLQALEEDRRTLLDYCARSSDDDPYAHNLMKSTYALQRHFINGAKTLLKWKELVAKWHVLEIQPLFLCHANLLLGSDVHSVWDAAFSNDHQMYNFFSEYADKQFSCKARKMKEFLQTAAEAVVTLDCDMPKRLVILLLLAHYLGDDVKEFFLLVKEQLPSVEEVKQRAANVSKCPLLIVNGLSIFDPQAKAFVVVRGELVLVARGVLNGALLVVLSYFVFNIQYPKKLARTLEFLQRYFLNINPAQSRINAQVASLAGKLADYEGRTSRWA